MRSLKFQIFLIGSLVIASLTACQPGAAQPGAAATEKPAVEATAPQNAVAPTSIATLAATQPPQAPAPTQTPQEAVAGVFPTLPPPQPGPETLDLEKIPEEHGFSDFTETYTVDMRWTDPEEIPQQSATTYLYRQQTVPGAASYFLYDDNNPFFASKIETVVTDQGAFSITPETGCQMTQVEGVQSLDQRQAFRSLLEALTGQATRTEAEVMLVDQATDVYTLQSSNLKPGAEIVLKASATDSNGEFTSSVSSRIALAEEGTTLESAKLYLARQGGYVRRIELVYSKTAGEDDALFAKAGSRMERTLVYDTTLAGLQSEAIALPAGCDGVASLAGGQAGSGDQPATMADLPRLEDITDVVETEDSLTYQANASINEAVEFYRSEMAALGWELNDALSMDTLANLEFTRYDQSVSISIIQAGDTVMVTLQLM